MISINLRVSIGYRNMSELHYIINMIDVYGEYDYMGIERC